MMRPWLLITLISTIVWVGLTALMLGVLAWVAPLRLAILRALQEPPVSEQSVSSSFTPSSEHEGRIVATVRQALPAVVSIVGSTTKSVSTRFPFEGSLLPFFGDETFPLEQQFQGTGFFVSKEGIIVTNRHVVSDEDGSYEVVTADGEVLVPERIWRDQFLDIAFIKVAYTPQAVLPLGDSSDAQLGQSVIAIGNALGEFVDSVSVGVLAGKGRSVVARGISEVKALESVLQTDAAINPGNSGGPLLTLDGKVLGVNVAVASGAENIGFAIPAEMVKPALRSIQEEGEIVRPWLGVRYRMITPEMVKMNSLPLKEGALIVRGSDPKQLAVIPGSPADKAGIEENDIITKVNNEAVTQSTPLGALIRRYAPGDAVKLEVYHEGEFREVTVLLDRAPHDLPE